jgi:predicted ATPase/transcriptional regulator with XRE-family HTH domain
MGEAQGFAAWLKRRRKALDLTQKELAERIGCSTMVIVKIETGDRRPSKQIAELLAAQLEIPLQERTAFIDFARTGRTADPLSSWLGGEEADYSLCAPGAAARLHGFPAPTTSFIGRAATLQTTRAMLGWPGVRLLTLTGPPGIGKTRLALEAASGLEGGFRDGLYFVPLALATSLAMVLPLLGAALGIREQGDQPLRESIRLHLIDKELLLVLDNMEHVLPASVVISQLLATAPRLKVLATSRMLLNLYGEHALGVPPLSLPDSAQRETVAELTRAEAMTLFQERAIAANPGFTITADNAPLIAELCTRLDGLPLAIELVAAQVRIVPLPALLSRMDHRLELLVDGPQDLPDRHQSLRSAIAWSYDLLSEQARRLFRRMAVFLGGCTVEAALVVASTDGRDPSVLQATGQSEQPTLLPEMLRQLVALVRTSLLQQQEGPAGEPCFGMLETIHEYAWERLRKSDEEDLLRLRHARYFLALVERAEAAGTGPEQVPWLERLTQEHDNIRAALSWSVETGQAELAARLAGAVSFFWLEHCHFAEGRHWLTTILSAGWNMPPARRAKAFNEAGRLARAQGDYAEAVRLHHESLALYRTLGDQRGVASALTTIQSALLFLGDYVRAAALMTESLALYRQHGDSAGVAEAQRHLGWISYLQGMYDQAAPLFEESLALHRALENMSGMGIAALGLGEVERARGNDERAAVCYLESLALYRELGNRRGEAASLHNLGQIARRRGDVAPAIALFVESMALSQSLRHQELIGLCIAGLGGVALDRGQHHHAVVLLSAVDALFRARGTPLEPSDRLELERNLAVAATSLDDPAWARAWAEGRALSLEQAQQYALTICAGPREPGGDAEPSASPGMLPDLCLNSTH